LAESEARVNDESLLPEQASYRRDRNRDHVARLDDLGGLP
jgi:hypothetical protein